jgi:hypothetical protein
MGFTKFTLADLKQLSSDKLDDADSLLAAGRFAACYYVTGYALEIILKYRIAKQLNWPSFDINDHRFLKTHELDVLIKYTGVFADLLKMPEWNFCREWSEEHRYQDSRQISRDTANKMLDYTRRLVTWLLAH